MALTYEVIQTASPTGTSSYTFSSIPSTYTDLVLVCSVLGSSGDLGIRFNNDTGSNYYYNYMTRATSTSGSGTSIKIGQLTSNSLTTAVVNINNYSASTLASKPMHGFGGWAGNSWMVGAGWMSSSVIDSITVAGGSNFSSPTKLTLYGIARA